jgi:uncharacterized protein YggT (Ycf19 family)
MIAQASLFLLDVLTAFLTVALLLRFYMQACRVSFHNQIGTFVVELTNWLVRPLRKVLPGWYGIDLASLLPAYLLQVSFVLAVWLCAAVPKAGRSRPGCRCCSGAACWPPCASASTC